MFSYLQYLQSITNWGSSHHHEVQDIARCTPEPLEPPPLNTDLPLPILPPEVVEIVVTFTGRPLFPPSQHPYDQYLKARKNQWKRLNGVVSATKYYRQLLLKRWFAVVVLHEPSDWDRVRNPDWMGGLEPIVCTVLAAKGALTSSLRNRTDTKVLTTFSRLTRVSLDYHSDFLRTGANYPYYQLITELPRTLEVLEILNAHGPDEHMIKLASRYCPNMTEIRLGRCTMFNNRDCGWWKAHPADHDAYMADRGVEAYASAVGNLIESMPKLRALHIGVYLTPIEAVWAHRVDHHNLHPIPDVMRHESPEGIHNHLHRVALAAANGEDPEPPIDYHYPPLAKKEIWAAPCSECDRHFKEPAEVAEMRVACVLSARVWSLRTVSFASFTSPGRVGLSSWEVRPKHAASDALLDGEDANMMLPQLEGEHPPIRRIKVGVGRLEGEGESFIPRKTFIYEISSFGGSIVVSPPINEPHIPLIF